MNCKMCMQQADIHNDPYFIMELETGYVMLGWFQRFKGYTVFQCKEHGPEIFSAKFALRAKLTCGQLNSCGAKLGFAQLKANLI